MRHPTHLHSGTIPWSKIRILVYGQDDAFRFLVRQTFRKLAVREVLSTSVPADATPLMGQAPDIALVDLEGEVDMALAFLKRVRTGDPGMPVLVVAKSDAHALLAPAQALGIDGLVPKPVSGHELVHRVQAALREPRRVPAPPPAAPPLPPSPAPARPAVPRAGHGGSAGHAVLAAGRKVNGGKLALGDGELPASPPKAPAGTYADDDAPPPPAAKTAPGTYGEVADDVPAKPAAKGRLDGLIAALPDMLKPKRRRKDEEEQVEAERARWQEELAEAGHHSRSGKDVAGLDVEAVVAAHLQWLTSQGAEGRRADFRRMDLAGGALAGTVLANAGFREADLSDARLAEARLDGADFRHASLAAADLAAADLGVAQLRHCDLRLANLQGACLRGADLSGARLRGAKLAGADLKGAILVGCDLSDADLSQVENLTQPQVDKAVCDAKTKLPPGIRPPRKDEG